MKSGAYRDYVIRLQEAIALLRIALNSTDVKHAGAAAKGATVLAAAALERFVNDALYQACKRISASKWEELAVGQQRYLAQQMARRALSAAQCLLDAGSNWEKKSESFRKVVEECIEGSRNPSAWAHHLEYGLFSEASTEPGRLDRIIRNFDPKDRSFYDRLDTFPTGRAPFLNALQQVTIPRHSRGLYLCEPLKAAIRGR